MGRRSCWEWPSITRRHLLEKRKSIEREYIRLKADAVMWDFRCGGAKVYNFRIFLTLSACAKIMKNGRHLLYLPFAVRSLFGDSLRFQQKSIYSFIWPRVLRFTFPSLLVEKQVVSALSRSPSRVITCYEITRWNRQTAVL